MKAGQIEYVYEFRFTYENIPYRLSIAVEEYGYSEARRKAIMRFESLLPHVSVDNCKITWNE